MKLTEKVSKGSGSLEPLGFIVNWSRSISWLHVQRSRVSWENINLTSNMQLLEHISISSNVGTWIWTHGSSFAFVILGLVSRIVILGAQLMKPCYSKKATLLLTSWNHHNKTKIIRSPLRTDKASRNIHFSNSRTYSRILQRLTMSNTVVSNKKQELLTLRENMGQP